ncbi:MAG: DUF58 domain-containing protein [Thermodesulfobacteriota bacterium]
MKSPVARLAELFGKRTFNMTRLPLPCILSRRFTILPTRHGWIFFAIVLAILFGSTNHNINLGFILAFLIAGMSFVSLIHSYRNLSGLTLLSARAEPVFASQMASFKLGLKNPGPAKWSLTCKFNQSENQTTIDLEDGEKKSITLCHSADQRGLLKPPAIVLSSTYPLGLFRLQYRLLPDISCLVYPAPVAGPPITSHELTSEDGEGQHSGPGVDDFSGLKNYQPGDQIQHLAWKSFSRGHGLQTKLFEGQRGSSIYLKLTTLPGRDIEWKLSRLCHMILQAESRQQTYGLKVGSHVIEPAAGGLHKKQCLQKLALYGREEK